MFGTLVIRKWVGGAERNCQEVTKIDLRQPAQAKIRYTISFFFPPVPLKLQNAESCWGAEHTNTLQRQTPVSGKEAATRSGVITQTGNTRTGRN